MKKITLLFALLFLMALPMLAQDQAIDPNVVNELLNVGIVGGMGVIALTELLKRKLNTQGAASIAISVVVSIAMALAYLLVGGTFTILSFILYSVVLAAAANGIYLFPRSRHG